MPSDFNSMQHPIKHRINWRLILASSIMLFWNATLATAQPPENWTVNPSDYEFSMTLIFSISIDGWTGEDEDIAALFDANGICRGVGETSFYNENTGWYTGLTLLYSNTSSLNGLTAMVFDTSEEIVLESSTTVDFQSNTSAGSLSNPIVITAVSDPDLGCTDPDACNFLPTATTDNGTCVYPSCVDETACNYETDAMCIDNNLCTYAVAGYDCAGICLNDFDQDGICDENEIPGCTDSNACNYSELATDDDCSCNYMVYPYGCDGLCLADSDNDGICDVLEVSGCTDPEACEYNPAATDEDGSCSYCCFQTGTTELDGASGFGLAIEAFATTEIDGLLRTAWRIYVTTSNLNDVVLGALGSAEGATFLSTSSSFYQHPEGSALASTITPELLSEHPELIFDSWLTVGLAQAATAPNASNATLSGASIWSTLFEFGEDIFLGNSMPGGWNVPNAAGNAIAGNDHRVLLAQLTTDGELSGSITVQVIPYGSSEPIAITLTFTPPVCGCMDSLACNFDSAALYDDGSCYFSQPWRDCDDICLIDTDGDGVCDEEEIIGCMDPTSPDYNPDATDEGTCSIVGCTYDQASNFNPEANVDDGSCTFDDDNGNQNEGCADLNLDQVVGTSDLLILLSQFGNECTP